MGEIKFKIPPGTPCEICKVVRRSGLKRRRIVKSLFIVCDECAKELVLTYQCMKIATDYTMRRFPSFYERTSDISVRPLIPIG